MNVSHSLSESKKSDTCRIDKWVKSVSFIATAIDSNGEKIKDWLRKALGKNQKFCFNRNFCTNKNIKMLIGSTTVQLDDTVSTFLTDEVT